MSIGVKRVRDPHVDKNEFYDEVLQETNVASTSKTSFKAFKREKKQ